MYGDYYKESTYDFVVREAGKMFTDWPFGTILGVVMALAIILVLALLIMLLFHLVDVAWIPLRRTHGTIGSKKSGYVSPTYFTDSNGIMNSVGGGMEYNLLVRVDDESAWTEVNRKFFNLVVEGERVVVHVGRGRLTGKLHIGEVCK